MKSFLNLKPEIIIVDDQQIFRQGLKAIINYENIGTVIGEAGNGEELIDLLSTLRPDLILLDIEMPRMNGFEALHKSLEILPDLKIIAFSVYSEEQYYAEMQKQGAKGFIQKSSGINELEQAIKTVMKGENYFVFKTHKVYVDDFSQRDKINLTKNKVDSTTQKGKMRFFPWYIHQDNNVRI